MKAICDLTPEEAQASLKTYEGIQAFRALIEYSRTSGYAHYKFIGSYKQELVDALGRHPTSTEIIMLVDNGYSNFGASCGINTSLMTFTGKINTD